jgi:hypothetical protein
MGNVGGSVAAEAPGPQSAIMGALSVIASPGRLDASFAAGGFRTPLSLEFRDASGGLRCSDEAQLCCRSLSPTGDPEVTNRQLSSPPSTPQWSPHQP